MNVPVIIVLKGVKPTAEKRLHGDDLEFNRFHRVLRLLMDSPLNKSKKMKIYIHTARNALVELSYLLEVPENPADLSDAMSYLLKRMVIKSSDGTVLGKVVKNPVTNHLPPNSTKIRLSPRGCKMSSKDLESSLERGFVFFIDIGREEEREEAEFDMKLSDFKLSPESCCAKITNMLEELLQIF
ncbi:ribosomal RNA small subunit methyltransferase [Encephalitozoon cuniculi]|nr:ribosomal RNA small subunit methyltransferase [Encephalitozoon cuniculi]